MQAAQPVRPNRAGPGSGMALSQAGNIGRKKGRSDRRKEEGEEAWSLEPFPRRPAPLQPGSQARNVRAGFMSSQAGLGPEH